MTVTVEFDTGPLHDAVQKASRVAPVKGAAFDKASGIVIEVSPGGATVMATNLDVTYQQKVKVISFDGDPSPRRWRMPSTMLASLVSALPLGAGNSIKFVDQEDSSIRITCGRMVAKFPTIDPSKYPLVPEFDATGMAEANEFAGRVEQVAWAALKDKADAFGGVHIDGKRLIACDRLCLAIVPCEIAVVEPINAPLDTLAALLKTATDVKAKADGKKLLLQLDAETQATTSLIEGKYPNVDKAVIRDDFTISLTFKKSQLVEVVNRMLVLVRGESLPQMSLTISTEDLLPTLIFDIENGENGRIRDAVDIETDFKGEFSWVMTPQYLLNATGGSRDEEVTMKVGSPKPGLERMGTVLIKDSRGYQCHIAPRKEIKKS